MDKILIRGLTKVFPARYGAVTALLKLDLVFREGEFCVLLGPSGCGKTTLIRIIAGLERQTGGEVSIARSHAGKPATAMVFQQDSAFPWMLYDKMVMPWLDPNGAVNRQSLRFDQEWYVKNGFVARAVNLSLVVDDRFVLYAVEKLGRYQ